MTSLEQLGRLVAEEQDALRARSGVRVGVRERLAGLTARPVKGRSRLTPWHAAVVGGALAAAAVLLATRARVSAPAPAVLSLHASSSTAPVAVGTWLEAEEGRQPLELWFSDGTRIQLAAGTRARVVAIDAHGAHLLIESGLAHVAVRHRADTDYRLSVGPFGVHVVGTRFDVRWDPERDAFGLDLREGRVELSGCVFGRSYAVRAGQVVDASCKHERLHVDGVEAPGMAARAARGAEADLPSGLAGAGGKGEPPERPGDDEPARRSAPGWRALAKQGKYAAAFAVARAAGFSDVCEQVGADDLALLSEVARYADARSEEASALRLLRRRFAGTPRAAVAAFALGRLEFDDRHAYAKAARWFDLYLKEQPDGALAREAHGRLIEAALFAGNRGYAQKRAADYLRKYPGGPHTELATSLQRD